MYKSIIISGDNADELGERIAAVYEQANTKPFYIVQAVSVTGQEPWLKAIIIIKTA